MRDENKRTCFNGCACMKASAKESNAKFILANTFHLLSVDSWKGVYNARLESS